MQELEADGGYAIVGCGRLGCAMADALVATGRSVVAVHSRTPAAATELSARLPDAMVAASLADVVARADTVVLTVPDAQIGVIADGLPVAARHGVVHCSGGVGLTALAACAARGASVGCFHPLQSFPDRRDGSARLRDIAIGVEAEGPLAARLHALVAALGSRVVNLAGVDRGAYHAAAVFSSNYLVALFSAATKAWQRAGLPPDDACSALLPLAAGALAAVRAAPPEQALTGPLVRGDVATIERQLDALDFDPGLRALYCHLGQELLSLGLPSDEPGRQELLALLR